MNSILRNPSWLIPAGLIIFCVWLMTGCNPSPQPTPIDPTSTNPPSVTPTATLLATSTQEATPTAEVILSPTPEPLQRPQYQITADLDYANHQVIVQERVRIANPAGKVLGEIDLVVPPNSWGGAFSIQDIKVAGAPLADYSLEGVKLNLVLAEPGWQPADVVEIHLDFTLKLPRQNDRPGYGPSPFGYSELQTNLVDWYPMIPPYQDDVGWVIHDPWLFGEYLVYPAADYEIVLTLGRPDLIVAASAGPLSEGDVLHYSLKEARNFVFSISPAYQVLEEDIQGVKVYGYFFPAYQTAGQAAFETTLQALALYQDLYGPYQQSSISMVQADFYHGMEYEGLYFQSRGFFDTYTGSEESYLVAIAAHETAHQWWYGGVANDQALEPWLDEALCTFSELAFYEHLYPESVDWWWSTRVDFHNPVGRIDRSIYDYQEFEDQYLNYRNATYLQGAKFMSVLKDVMGDEALYTFLADYQEQFQNQIASGDDFFTVLNAYLVVEDQDWLEEYFWGE